MKKKISATGLSYAVNKGGKSCRIVGLGTYDQNPYFVNRQIFNLPDKQKFISPPLSQKSLSFYKNSS